MKGSILPRAAGASTGCRWGKPAPGSDGGELLGLFVGESGDVRPGGFLPSPSYSKLPVMPTVTLVERRKALGISQQKLAELAGCSMGTVRLVEAGYQYSQSSEKSELIEQALAEAERQAA